MVGYLLEELRDSSNFAAFRQDMSVANVFIGSLIFIEELADKVSCLPCLIATCLVQMACVPQSFCTKAVLSSALQVPGSHLGCLGAWP